MGYRYRTGERIYGGSMEPRLNPEFGGDRINQKLGPSRPTPLVRNTSSSGCIREQQADKRRKLIGLPPKFDREDY